MIRFLSPFSNWDKDESIIPIFESSVCFQGYFAQAFPHLPKNYDYYVFCADDLLLNPTWDENNLIENLGCNESGYIKYLNPIWEHSFAWHKFEECNSFPDNSIAVPINHLPNRDSILKRYELFSIKYRNLGFHNLRGIHDKTLSWERFKSGILFLLKNGPKRYVHFPLIEGYSDFIVVPKESLEQFCYYCGIFSAMKLWVDAAVATSLVLSCNKIVEEKDPLTEVSKFGTSRHCKIIMSNGWYN